MRTTAEETQRNYELIINTAIKLFSEKGYAAANMQDIADAAGISRGPLYYHFKNKAALYEAALKTWYLQELGAYRSIFAGDGPILDKIRADMIYCTRTLRGQGDSTMFTASQDDDVEEARRLSEEFTNQIYEIKLESARKAISRGELKPETNPRHIVNLLFIFYEGLAATRKNNLLISAGEVDTAIDDLLDLIRAKYCV